MSKVIRNFIRFHRPRKSKKNPDQDIELQAKGDLNIVKKACIICVGTMGSGKSSTVGRYTLKRAQSSAGFERQTQQCEIFQPSCPGEPAWIDTVGWEDKNLDDDESFQDILKFLCHHQFNQIKAIIWNVIPNVRYDSTINKQAKLIDKFKPREIWANVVIVCKQSMKPERDGCGARKAAEELAKEGLGPQVTGYRFFSDLDDDQKDRMEADPDLRKTFNVKTDDEVRQALREKLDCCPEPVDLVFTHHHCMDCGAEGDPRLMPLYCHMESHHVHNGDICITHPGGLEWYHENDRQIVEHPGKLERPWYGFGCFKGRVRKRYSCCNKTYGKVGCQAKWACCQQIVKDDDGYDEDPESGCKSRFTCCSENPADNSTGCQPRYICCNGKSSDIGCVERCRKCGKMWGTLSDRCYKKPHNVILAKLKESSPIPRNEIPPLQTFWNLPPLVLSKPF